MQVTALIRGDANSVYARLSDGSYLRFNGTESFLNQYDVHTTSGTSGGITDGVIDLSALMANLDETEIHHFVDTTGGGFELVKLSDGHMAVVRDNGEVFQFFEDGLNNYDNPGPEASDGIIDINQMSQNTGSISITRWTDSSGQGFELSQGTEDTHFITRANGEVYFVRTTNSGVYDGYDGADGEIDVSEIASRVGQDEIRQFISSGNNGFTIEGSTGDRGFFVRFDNGDVMFGRTNAITDYDRMLPGGGFSGVNTQDGTIDVDAMVANAGLSGVYIFEDTTGVGFDVTQTGEGGGMIITRDNGEVLYMWAGSRVAADNYSLTGPTGNPTDGRIDVASISANVGHMYVHRFIDSVGGAGFKVEPGPDQSIIITRANGDFLIIDPNEAFNGTYDNFSATTNSGGVNDGVIDIEFLFQNAGSNAVFRFTPLCIASGALLKTIAGEKKIEDLLPDDRVLTLDRGYMPVRWKGTHSFTRKELQGNEKLRPVRISAGALGDGLPERDLIVSRQHRVLFRTKIAERMFGVSEVLVAAINLTELPGIYVENDCEAVCYHHLLFDTHAVIFADGAPVESLFTGKEAMKSVSPEARAEILEIFPNIMDAAAVVQNARYIPSGKRQKRLVERHLRNDKPPLEAGAPQTLH